MSVADLQEVYREETNPNDAVRNAEGGAAFLTADTKLSYADLSRLHLTARLGKPHGQRAVPQWVYSRDAIQRVILAKLKRYAKWTGAGPDVLAASSLAELEELARVAQQKIRKHQYKRKGVFHVDAHLQSVKSRSLAALWLLEIYWT